MSIKIIQNKFIVNECFAKEFLDNEKICILNLYDYFKKYKEITENFGKKECDDIIFGLFPDIDRISWSIDYPLIPEITTCDQFKFIKITFIHNVITEYREIIEKNKRIEIEKLKDEVEKSKHDFLKEKNDFLIKKNEILDEIKNDFVEVYTELAVKKIKTPKLEKFINKYKNL